MRSACYGRWSLPGKNWRQPGDLYWLKQSLALSVWPFYFLSSWDAKTPSGPPKMACSFHTSATVAASTTAAVLFSLVWTLFTYAAHRLRSTCLPHSSSVVSVHGRRGQFFANSSCCCCLRFRIVSFDARKSFEVVVAVHVTGLEHRSGREIIVHCWKSPPFGYKEFPSTFAGSGNRWGCLEPPPRQATALWTFKQIKTAEYDEPH